MPASLSQLKASMRKSLVIADVLEISPKHQRMMNALLQEEDDGVPESDFEFHTEDLGTCEQDIGTAEEALSDAQAMLADDETYLKDLTAKCELKAREWDQRSKMRGDELSALNGALGVMTDRVKVKSDQANKRALVQKDDSYIAPDTKAAAHKEDVEDDDVGDVSFLQRGVGDLLKRAQERHAQKVEEDNAEAEQAMEKVQSRSVQSGTKEQKVLELIRE